MSNTYKEIIWQKNKKLQAPELNEFQSIVNEKIENIMYFDNGGNNYGIKSISYNLAVNSITISDCTVFAKSNYFNIKNKTINNIFPTSLSSSYNLYVKIEGKIITSADDINIAIPITLEETSKRIRFDVSVLATNNSYPNLVSNSSGETYYVKLGVLTGNKDIVPQFNQEDVALPKLERFPKTENEVASKGYVDSVSQGLDTKQSVRVATTVNITLTGTKNIDGVNVQVGDRVLVKDQTNKKENGIYIVGTPWVRASDATQDKLTSGTFTFVEEGTINGGGGFVLVTKNPINIGTTNIEFTRFSGAGQLIAEGGIEKDGNIIRLTNTGVSPGTYKSVTVDAKGRITSGTNPTTLSGYGITDAVNSSDVVTTATPNKILKLNSSGYLPTNALTASRLLNPITISLIGDVTGSISFDGSSNISIVTTYKNSGVSPGTYRTVTVDAKGVVTSGSNPTTLSGYGITDAVNSSDVVTSATPNKILKLNSSGLLPASITGNATTVGNLQASQFLRSDTNTTTTGSLTANGGFITGTWFKSTGATGWMNTTYSGGIFMNDSNWLRVYNGKSFLVEGTLRSNGAFVLPVGTNKYSTLQ